MNTINVIEDTALKKFLNSFPCAKKEATEIFNLVMSCYNEAKYEIQKTEEQEKINNLNKYYNE